VFIFHFQDFPGFRFRVFRRTARARARCSSRRCFAGWLGWLLPSAGGSGGGTLPTGDGGRVVCAWCVSPIPIRAGIRHRTHNYQSRSSLNIGKKKKKKKKKKMNYKIRFDFRFTSLIFNVYTLNNCICTLEYAVTC